MHGASAAYKRNSAVTRAEPGDKQLAAKERGLLAGEDGSKVVEALKALDPVALEVLVNASGALGGGGDDADSDDEAEGELIASAIVEGLRTVLAFGLAGALGVSFAASRFDPEAFRVAAAFASAPVLMGAVLLLPPWGGAPTSGQLLNMQKAAATVTVSDAAALLSKRTMLTKPVEGSWREAMALLQAFFIEPWELGKPPKTARVRALTLLDRLSTVVADEALFRGCLAAWLGTLVLQYLASQPADESSPLFWLRALGLATPGAALWAACAGMLLVSAPSYAAKARGAQRFVRASALDVSALFQAFDGPDEWLVRIRRAPRLGAPAYARPRAFMLPEELPVWEGGAEADEEGRRRREQQQEHQQQRGSSGEPEEAPAATTVSASAATVAAAARGVSPSVSELRGCVNSIYVLTTLQGTVEVAAGESQDAVAAGGSKEAAAEGGTQGAAGGPGAPEGGAAADGASGEGSGGVSSGGVGASGDAGGSPVGVLDPAMTGHEVASTSSIGGSIATSDGTSSSGSSGTSDGGREGGAAAAPESPFAAAAAAASGGPASAAGASTGAKPEPPDAPAGASWTGGRQEPQHQQQQEPGSEERAKSAEEVSQELEAALERLISGPYGRLLRRSAVEDGVRSTTTATLVTAEDELAARVMVLYAVVLDASAYGSFAASGGNLLASVAAGVLVSLGVGAVSWTGEAIAKARLAAAGRTKAFLKA